MKVFFYINVLGGGGAERAVANLSSQFAEHGYEVGVITSFQIENEYSLDSRVIRYNLEKEQVLSDSKIKRNIRRVKALRTILKKDKPDLLIAFMLEPNFRAVLSACGTSVKTIVSARNDPQKEYSGILGKFVGKFIMPFANGCVFQTYEAMTWFPMKLQKKSRVIANAVEESFFVIERHTIKDSIVTAGRLTTQKNQKILIDAFVQIANEFPRSNLYIYGEGILKEKLQKHIETLSLKDRVFLMGNINDMGAALSKSEIFVLSSNFEGMPNALMEAMASGIAVISTDCPCGGPRMLIDNKINGLLVPVENVNALTEAMRFLLNNKSYAVKIGNAAKGKMEFFRPEIIFREWENYINEVCK